MTPAATEPSSVSASADAGALAAGRPAPWTLTGKAPGETLVTPGNEDRLDRRGKLKWDTRDHESCRAREEVLTLQKFVKVINKELSEGGSAGLLQRVDQLLDFS